MQSDVVHVASSGPNGTILPVPENIDNNKPNKIENNYCCECKKLLIDESQRCPKCKEVRQKTLKAIVNFKQNRSKEIMEYVYKKLKLSKPSEIADKIKQDVGYMSVTNVGEFVAYLELKDINVKDIVVEKQAKLTIIQPDIFKNAMRWFAREDVNVCKEALQPENIERITNEVRKRLDDERKKHVVELKEQIKKLEG